MVESDASAMQLRVTSSSAPSDGTVAVNDLEINVRGFLNLMQEYRAAIAEVQTKFEILDEDSKMRFDRNPIHNITTRLKSPTSLVDKLRRRELPVSLHSMRTNIFDIAGVRVVCNYLDDVYEIADSFLRQDDVHLINRKDYIATPKPSGYRSLHLVVSVPVFLADGRHQIPVEVQLRTIAQDFWATLEHRLRYKNEEFLAPGETVSAARIDADPAMYDVRSRLIACADGIAGIDEAMQQIRHDIDQMNLG